MLLASKGKFLKKLAALFFVVSFTLGISLFNSNVYAEKVTFQDKENTLSAHYMSPDKNVQTKGVIVFVHGDGALPYDAYDYYDPIWDRILDADYAVFSWDKPGVGSSTGNWLNQSMEDRQDEVRAAISFLKEKYGYKEGQIGLMGFSQAGWVVPAVTKDNKDVGFMIGVGFAMNWMDQGWYLGEIRMKNQGRTIAEIESAYQKRPKEFAFLKTNPSYAEYQEKYGNDDAPMTQDRFIFVKKNFLSDATDDYQGIRQPILILLGEEDLNVNVENTQNVLRKIFSNQSNMTMHMIPNATHGLLKHPKFSEQKPGLAFLLRLMWEGENAYTDEFFQNLDGWLRQTP